MLFCQTLDFAGSIISHNDEPHCAVGLRFGRTGEGGRLRHLCGRSVNPIVAPCD